MSAGDDDQRPQHRGSGLSRRSGVWLTTVSTVVAVATGMFTLRDQIFPQESPEAQASVSQYQQSIGEVCDSLNEAEKARATNERRLATRLRRTRTTLDQRNLLLDSQREILANSEHVFGDFTGLDAPKALSAHERKTVAAWERILKRLHGYTERLAPVDSRRDLLREIRTLPAMYTELAEYRVTRASGLTRLGGGRCKLDPPIVSPTITLPGRSRPVNPPPGNGSHGGVKPPVGNTGSSTPPAAPGGSTTPPPPPPPPAPPSNPGPGGGAHE